VLAVLFIAMPRLILSPFARPADPLQPATLAAAARCLRYITAYLMFDTMCIIYSHAIKGAGDTRFSMWMGLALSWGVLVVPSYVAYRAGASAWTLWSILVGQVVLAGLVFYGRYRGGKWQSMKAIEDTVVPGEPAGLTAGVGLDRG
jgi:MATE family multidrug resistance protein